jgi:hypothetical protein
MKIKRLSRLAFTWYRLIKNYLLVLLYIFTVTTDVLGTAFNLACEQKYLSELQSMYVCNMYCTRICTVEMYEYTYTIPKLGIFLGTLTDPLYVQTNF